MFYGTEENDHGHENDPFKALVAPRPIGWISSMSSNGVVNLAPYSFFNAMSDNPHYVVFGSAGRKDSITNIVDTGEFVCNMATWELREKMNQSSAPVASGVDEFELAGLEKAACRNVSVPRVAASPVALECILNQVVTLKARDGKKVQSEVIFGEVVGIHISDDVIVNGMLDISLIRPLARLGYMDYAIVEEVFPMKRPTLSD